MVPPPGYKFIPRTEKICGEPGCFECYDVFCERCETKDRRIIELEMRAADMAKHINLLHARLQKTPQGSAIGGAVGGAAQQATASGPGQPIASMRSPMLEDPV